MHLSVCNVFWLWDLSYELDQTYIDIWLNIYQMAHWLFNGHAMWLCRHWAITGNLSVTGLGTRLKHVSSVIQQVPIVNTTLNWIKPCYRLWEWLYGGMSVLFTLLGMSCWLVIWVSLLCNCLGNFNRTGRWIMQSCTADNFSNNDQDNVSPIWRRVLFYFCQIANRFAYDAIGDRQR